MRITAISVEMDGNDACAVVRGLTEAMQGKAVSAQPPAVSQPALIEAPTAPKNGRRRSPRNVAKAQIEEVQQFASLNDAVRQALTEGPKSGLELEGWMKARGMKPTSQQIYQATWTLRKNGEIYKADHDLKWRMAKVAGR